VNTLAIPLKRRDPAVIAARAHAVLDSAVRAHAQWPRAGRKAIGESAVALDSALED
jgi:hypothetical protein